VLAAVSAASVIVPFVLYGPDPHWNANAKRVAKIEKECPSTKVYVTSGWLYRDGADSKTARREDPVYARGYARLGENHGSVPEYIGRKGPTEAMLGNCPTLLWVEHVPDDMKIDPKKALATAGLTGLDDARLSVFTNDGGFIVRADRR
jgi:hypothetical protein